jgi:hypothetical protein
MAVTTPPSLSTNDEWIKEATTTQSPTPSASLTTSQTQAEKTGYRKVDIKLLLWYSFVYLIMRIHVQNVTNSAIMNLETGHGIKAQLGNLDSEQWALVISIFYYPYMFLEPPATLLLKRFSPSKWMARIMITWGVISMCQGAAQNYAGLLACRFFLGAAEAGSVFGMIDVFMKLQCFISLGSRMDRLTITQLLPRRPLPLFILVSKRSLAASYRLLLRLRNVLRYNQRAAGVRDQLHEWAGWPRWLAVDVHHVSL